jgi:hypothetical protein
MNAKRLLAIPLLIAAFVVMWMSVSRDSSEPVLGPADGHDLARQDLERVAVGTVAPDFSLRALSGAVETLSSYRGSKNVVLVFYRGHW